MRYRFPPAGEWAYHVGRLSAKAFCKDIGDRFTLFSHYNEMSSLSTSKQMKSQIKYAVQY
jgi:hypothetical protein